MLHLIFDGRPWFRPKNRGYGSGLPVAWQGWALLAAHVALIAGVSMLLQGRPAVMSIFVILAAVAPLPLYRAKTEGGWR